MTDNVERSRAGHANFNVGRMEDFLANLAPQCAWISPAGSLFPGTFIGPQELLQRFFMPLGERFAVTVAVASYHDIGDTVISRGHYDFTHRASGRQLRLPMIELADWHGGKLRRHEAFFDTALARDVAAEAER